jgi:hypothetical protein
MGPLLASLLVVVSAPAPTNPLSGSEERVGRLRRAHSFPSLTVAIVVFSSDFHYLDLRTAKNAQ